MISVMVPLPDDLYDEVQASGMRVSDVVQEALRAELVRRNSLAALDLRFVTPAEWRVLGYLTTHHTLAEIGERLHISRTTVKSHVASIYAKLNVRTRSELVTRLACAPAPIDHCQLHDVAV